MYRYTELDQRLVDERVAQFRDQVERWKGGALSDDELRPLRLQNGLYVQRHAPMLRVAVPYGALGAHQLRALARIARTWDRGYGHFSTRQNIQFNWVAVEDAPDVLAALAQVQMHAIQTSGNCVRNITTDPFAGVAPDEAVDPRPYCELMRQWSTFHPEFSFLPRKFKIAFCASATEDRAATAMHDLGFYLRCASRWRGGRRRAGGRRHGPHAGGRFDRAPRTSLAPPAHVHGGAAARVQPLRPARQPVQGAHQDPGARARRRGVRRRGRGRVRRTSSTARAPRPPPSWRASPRTSRAPPYRDLQPAPALLAQQAAGHPGFARWRGRNVRPHRVPGYAAVTLSLKRGGSAPGDIDADTMDAVADLAERFSFGELRVTHEQNLVLADVAEHELLALWTAAARAGAGDAEHRPAHRHDLLPGRRLLRAGQRQVDSDRAGAPGTLRRPRLPARPGRPRA